MLQANSHFFQQYLLCIIKQNEMYYVLNIDCHLHPAYCYFNISPTISGNFLILYKLIYLRIILFYWDLLNSPFSKLLTFEINILWVVGHVHPEKFGKYNLNWWNFITFKYNDWGALGHTLPENIIKCNSNWSNSVDFKF